MSKSATMEVPDGWGLGLLGAGTTLIGGVLLWLAQRLLGKAAVQQAVNQGFVNLMTETRTALKEACEQRDEFKRLLVTEKAGRAADRAFFAGEIRQLRAVSEGLERLLNANGISIPERKVYAPQPVEIVETTLRQDLLYLDLGENQSD